MNQKSSAPLTPCSFSFPLYPTPFWCVIALPIPHPKTPSSPPQMSGDVKEMEKEMVAVHFVAVALLNLRAEAGQWGGGEGEGGGSRKGFLPPSPMPQPPDGGESMKTPARPPPASSEPPLPGSTPPSSSGPGRPKATRRRTRRRATSAGPGEGGGTATSSVGADPPLDPAEQLTEMSVRGLNLFRYASVSSEGVYKCMECEKVEVTKTFKNKYSFQRHAFLYHEGLHRKVFPCPVCGKEFSRPDKMKNHMKTVHDCFMPKDCVFPLGFFLPP